MDIFEKICADEIANTMTIASATGRFEEIKNRRYYGLSFCLGGQITYYHNGKKYVQDKEHAIILPQNASYFLTGDKKGLFPVINFYCAKKLCDSFEVIECKNPDSLLKDYEKLRDLMVFDRNRAKELSLFYNIIYKLTQQDENKIEVLIPAIKYIEKNYNNPNITNEILAGLCNVSEVYFRRLFTGKYAMTPKQFIVNIRIEKAKQLLKEGQMNIGEVAKRSGFTNPYHFSRIFKEKVGITPTQYTEKTDFS